MAKSFYITTPIYYVNSVPHVGHALTMLVSDAEARYHRLRGRKVVFLTGTDENATKVWEAALEKGRDPMEFVDEISKNFQDAFQALNFSYDVFYRTTEDRHTRAVQKFFSILKEKGFVYEDAYEGWYDVSAETFVRKEEVVDGKSPDGNPVRWVAENNYFFRASAFGDILMKKIEAEPNWLQPPGRKNEVISFIKEGLRDICITRDYKGWGIKVPGEDSKVIYVWFDALINYLAATGWGDDDPQWTDIWPADVHWMAKEIFTRFHATLWPAMLMAADVPVPKQVIAHGWFTFNESKMSKSKGNVIGPYELIDYFVEKAGCSKELAVDAARYALARSLPYDGDANFNWDEINKNYNSDLANDLGNALNRSLSMAHKFVGGVVPDGGVEVEAMEACHQAKAAVESALEGHRVDLAVSGSLDLIRWLNKYIDTRAPWALAKNSDPALPEVIRSMLLALRTSGILIAPILPSTSKNIAEQLGLSEKIGWDEAATEGALPAGTQLGSPVPMFPRLEIKKPEPEAPAPKKEREKPKAPAAPAEIEYADFSKVSLKVARIVEAEPVEGSEKLMKLQVTIGEEQRQILAGIKKKYSPEDLIGRQIVVVANLKPAKLMGQDSQGMLLAADDADGSPILLQPDTEAPEGANVH